jgi:threonine dehydrogenase-like Zn-dependent dehydrogenase
VLLAYMTTGKGEITPTLVEEPAPPELGEVGVRFESLTPCSTDLSNVNGRTGHSFSTDAPKTIGHETCCEVTVSQHRDVPEGKYIVTLGNDWFGLSERATFRPVLPSTDDSDIPLALDLRGPILDPIASVKAVCVLDKWFKGASLLEPLTHVLTAFQRIQALISADTVLVLGAGFCGITACALAKIFGTKKVVVMDVNSYRMDFAIKHGFADEGLNPATDSVLIRRLVRQTGGAFADAVFDALPAMVSEEPDTRSLAADLLRPAGTWVIYAPAKKMTVPAATYVAKGIQISNAPYDSRLISFRRRARTMQLAYSLIRSGDIPVDIFISRSINFFDEKAVTQSILEYGHGTDIKVEILYSGGESIALPQTSRAA